MSTKIWLKVMGKMTIIDHPLIHWMWEIQILRQTPQGEYYTYKYMLTPPPVPIF